MPEGPEIHRLADELQQAITQKPLIDVQFSFASLKPYQAQLIHQHVTHVDAQGKALLTHFSNGLTLYSHNQLYGRWVIAPHHAHPVSNRSLRACLDTAQISARLYSASDIEIWPTATVKNHPFLQRIGPDVLDSKLSLVMITDRLQQPTFNHRQLGTLLLDQAFMAGLGNYLRVEILWAARLSPLLRPCDLSAEQIDYLSFFILEIPRLSYTTRGKIIHEGNNFSFQAFKRQHEPCPRCGSLIQKIAQASRPFYYCPHCNPL